MASNVTITPVQVDPVLNCTELAWCDCVDSICLIPPTEVVEFPERCDDTSNAALPTVDKLTSNSRPTDVKVMSKKRPGSDLCVPKAKRVCLTPSAVGEPPSALCSEGLNVLQTVQILLGGRASNVLMSLATFTYDQLCISLDMIEALVGLCVQLLISLFHMLH